MEMGGLEMRRKMLLNPLMCLLRYCFLMSVVYCIECRYCCSLLVHIHQSVAFYVENYICTNFFYSKVVFFSAMRMSSSFEKRRNGVRLNCLA